MTLAPSSTTQDFVWLVEIELARRLEGAAWTVGDSGFTACFYVAHPEGKPSRVQECLLSSGAITTYAERASLALCQANASSWYWDAATGRLYVHASTGADPSTSGTFLIKSRFWERIADRQIDLGGYPYRPLLDPASLEEITLEATQFSEGGIRQSFSSITLLNGDGYFDSRLNDYIYSAAQAILKVGAPGDDYANFVTIWKGWTGRAEWSDEGVVIGFEDERRIAED